MNPWPVDAEVEESHLPRPGHADLAGLHKYGFTDVRNVLERASARETAARVAAGAVAKEFLRALGVEIRSHVLQIASVVAESERELELADFDGVDESPVRVLDPAIEEAMVEEINTLAQAEREPRRGLRGPRLRAYPRPGLLRELGGAARLAPRSGGRVDPGREGRRGRGGVGRGRPAGLRVPRRDLLLRGARLVPRDEPRRAASRAA